MIYKIVRPQKLIWYNMMGSTKSQIFLVLNNVLTVMLQIQIILQYFYKLLMWQFFTSSKMDPSLTSHF